MKHIKHKPIRYRLWRRTAVDYITDFVEPLVFTVGFAVVLLDLFVWRP